MNFEKEEKFALMLLIIVFFAVLASHLILSTADKSSFAKTYTNSSAEGELVVLTANVSEIYKTNTGGHLIIKTSGPDIFFRLGADYEDLFSDNFLSDKKIIKATGLVSVYNGNAEIIVSDLKDIEFLESEVC
ncbi:hypothetical protein L1994_10930 [Methanomicrobium antiquum]|uniref:Uncharacterized protein n=1 Tax=Methanomicrobium antiquum TaxID=487686 RepID=A0AAF0JMK6_9EURY|nr:hypothetical protein [Methanomicrobium antiquum]WFN36640.1 hypothetical protein L1994_10930 [Methanomicrobium antiquum]